MYRPFLKTLAIIFFAAWIVMAQQKTEQEEKGDHGRRDHQDNEAVTDIQAQIDGLPELGVRREVKVGRHQRRATFDLAFGCQGDLDHVQQGC